MLGQIGVAEQGCLAAITKGTTTIPTAPITTTLPVRPCSSSASMSIINMQQGQDGSRPGKGRRDEQEEEEQRGGQGEQGVSLERLCGWREQLSELYENDITLRMKYPDEPMRFYQAEEEIDNILSQLQELTQDHIPLVVQSQLLLPLLKLLGHPNSDLNAQCIQLLHQLIAQEPTDEKVYQVYYRMCVWLIENGVLQGLAGTLERLDEEGSVQEYQMALQVLKLIEALVELWEEAAEQLVTDTKLLDYLANRILPNFTITHKVIDDNKFVSSDVLALLLTNSHAAQQKFHKLCGVQILLESVRPYLSKAPASNDEQEYMSNLLDCLTVLLINPSEQLRKSREVYHSMKGNEIMLQFVRARNAFSLPALKVIAASFTSALPEQEVAIVEELVDLGALKYLFAIILRQGVRGGDVDEQRAIDEAALSVVYVMVRATSEVYRARVQSKFTENRFQKLEKLFEIRAENLQTMGKEGFDEVNSEEYLGLLKEGLTVVETIDKIVACLVLSNTTVRDRLIALMQLYGVSYTDLEVTLRNQYKFMGESEEKARVQRLLSDNLPLLREALQRKQ